MGTTFKKLGANEHAHSMLMIVVSVHSLTSAALAVDSYVSAGGK